MPNDLLLGEIKGKLDMLIESQGVQNTKLDTISTRLSKVEGKASSAGGQMGGVVGSIAAIGVVLIKEKLGL